MGAIMSASGSSPVQCILKVSLVAAALLTTGALAQANTMTFGSASTFSPGSGSPSPYVEDGISATPTGDNFPVPHFDVSSTIGYGATPGDNVGIIHRGNGGEEVTFTFSGGLFDLESFDVTGWDLDGDTALTATFAASSGATHTVSFNDVVTIDFSAISGWSNISFFTFTVPSGVEFCLNGAHCPGVGFDNIVMNAPSPVPLPGALPLLATSLAGLGYLARRRRDRPRSLA